MYRNPTLKKKEVTLLLGNKKGEGCTAEMCEGLAWLWSIWIEG